MNYLLWATLALLAYSLVPPLTKLATDGLSSNVVALVSNGILAVLAFAVVVASGETGEITTAVTRPSVIAAGLCLGIGILAYYRALQLGPVSVVTPVFGMFLVTASVVSVLFLSETFSVQKALGILFAVMAVVLVSVDEELLQSALPF